MCTLLNNIRSFGRFCQIVVTSLENLNFIIFALIPIPTKVCKCWFLKINPLKSRFMESLCHTAILKWFEFLRQLNKKQNMIKKNYQLNWNEKFVEKAQQCFVKIQICCRVKLIPWDVVNLSHLHKLGIIFYRTLSNVLKQSARWL